MLIGPVLTVGKPTKLSVAEQLQDPLQAIKALGQELAEDQQQAEEAAQLAVDAVQSAVTTAEHALETAIKAVEAASGAVTAINNSNMHSARLRTKSTALVQHIEQM